MLSNKHLLTQQWGGSPVPVIVASVDQEALAHPGRLEEAVCCAWCNDAMHRLAGDPARKRPEQDILHQLMDSNPVLRCRVRDTLDKMTKGAGLVTTNVIECSLIRREGTAQSRSSSLSISIIPFYLEAARHRGASRCHRGAQTPGCGWQALVQACLRPRATTTAPLTIALSSSAPGVVSLSGGALLPALLLQCEMSSSPAPPSVPSTAPGLLLRPRAPALPHPINQQQQQQLFRTHSGSLGLVPSSFVFGTGGGNIINKSPRALRPEALITSSFGGGSGADGGRAAMAAALVVPSGLAAASGGGGVDAGGGLSRQLTFPSNTARRVVAQLRTSTAGGPTRFFASMGAAMWSSRGGGAGGALGRGTATSGGGGGGACTLRERRNSLALAAVPIAVTIFALPSGAVLHQNAASIEYYGDRTSHVPPNLQAGTNTACSGTAGQVPLRTLLDTIDSDSGGGGGGKLSAAAKVAAAGTDPRVISGQARRSGLSAVGKEAEAEERQAASAAAAGLSQVSSASSGEMLELPPQQQEAAAAAEDGGGGRSGGGGDTIATAAAAAASVHVTASGDCSASMLYLEVDVLRQLFSLEYCKLERMLAALANEGDIWQGILRVPETLNDSMGPDEEEDPTHQRQGEDRLAAATGHEEGSAVVLGGKEGTAAAEVTAVASGRVQVSHSPGASSDDAERDLLGEDGDRDGDADLLGSMAGDDLHMAMQVVTEGLKQRIQQGPAAVGSTTGSMVLVEPPAVAATSGVAAGTSTRNGSTAMSGQFQAERRQLQRRQTMAHGSDAGGDTDGEGCDDGVIFGDMELDEPPQRASMNQACLRTAPISSRAGPAISATASTKGSTAAGSIFNRATVSAATAAAGGALVGTPALHDPSQRRKPQRSASAFSLGSLAHRLLNSRVGSAGRNGGGTAAGGGGADRHEGSSASDAYGIDHEELSHLNRLANFHSYYEAGPEDGGASTVSSGRPQGTEAVEMVRTVKVQISSRGKSLGISGSSFTLGDGRRRAGAAGVYGSAAVRQLGSPGAHLSSSLEGNATGTSAAAALVPLPSSSASATRSSAAALGRWISGISKAVLQPLANAGGREGSGGVGGAAGAVSVELETETPRPTPPGSSRPRNALDVSYGNVELSVAHSTTTASGMESGLPMAAAETTALTTAPTITQWEELPIPPAEAGGGTTIAAAAATTAAPASLPVQPRRLAPSRCLSVDCPAIGFPAVPEETASGSEGQLSRKHTAADLELVAAPSDTAAARAGHQSAKVSRAAKSKAHKAPGLLGRFLSYTVDAAQRRRAATVVGTTSAGRSLARNLESTPSRWRGVWGTEVNSTDDGEAASAGARHKPGWHSQQPVGSAAAVLAAGHTIHRSAHSWAVTSAKAGSGRMPSQSLPQPVADRAGAVSAITSPASMLPAYDGSGMSAISTTTNGAAGAGARLPLGFVPSNVHHQRSSISDYLSLPVAVPGSAMGQGTSGGSGCSRGYSDRGGGGASRIRSSMNLNMLTTMPSLPTFGVSTTTVGMGSSPPNRGLVPRRQSFSLRRSMQASNGLATSTWQVLMPNMDTDASGGGAAAANTTITSTTTTAASAAPASTAAALPGAASLAITTGGVDVVDPACVAPHTPSIDSPPLNMNSPAGTNQSMPHSQQPEQQQQQHNSLGRATEAETMGADAAVQPETAAPTQLPSANVTCDDLNLHIRLLETAGVSVGSTGAGYTTLTGNNSSPRDTMHSILLPPGPSQHGNLTTVGSATAGFSEGGGVVSVGGTLAPNSSSAAPGTRWLPSSVAGAKDLRMLQPVLRPCASQPLAEELQCKQGQQQGQQRVLDGKSGAQDGAALLALLTGIGDEHNSSAASREPSNSQLNAAAPVVGCKPTADSCHALLPPPPAMLAMRMRHHSARDPGLDGDNGSGPEEIMRALGQVETRANRGGGGGGGGAAGLMSLSTPMNIGAACGGTPGGSATFIAPASGPMGPAAAATSTATTTVAGAPVTSTITSAANMTAAPTAGGRSRPQSSRVLAFASSLRTAPHLLLPPGASGAAPSAPPPPQPLSSQAAAQVTVPSVPQSFISSGASSSCITPAGRPLTQPGVPTLQEGRGCRKSRSSLALVDAFSGSSLYGCTGPAHSTTVAAANASNGGDVTGGGGGGVPVGGGGSSTRIGSMPKASSFSCGGLYGMVGASAPNTAAEETGTEVCSTPRTRPSPFLPSRQSLLLRIGSSALSKTSLLTSGVADTFVPELGLSQTTTSAAAGHGTEGGPSVAPLPTGGTSTSVSASTRKGIGATSGGAGGEAGGEDYVPLEITIAGTGGNFVGNSGISGDSAGAGGSNGIASTGAASAAARGRKRQPTQQSSPEQAPESALPQQPPRECWHEVCATSVVDPVTGSMAVVLVQQDVTAKVVAERHVHQVAEVEHRLLEQIFPRHVLQYITEESVAPSINSVLSPVAATFGMESPGGGGGGGGGSPWGATAGASAGSVDGPEIVGSDLCMPPLHPPLSVSSSHPLAGDNWRPQIRDCNRLATWHPKVTVLFADIQGFTPMCKVLPPRVVMAFLNTLFTRFDAMLDYYRVYKVETIGDCYMVAGGLIREDEDGMAAVQGGGQVDPDQAANVFAFAKAMLRAAVCVRLPTSGQPVRVRVGVHSGPVVSGVVGTRMPRFCLFGDTVNTASRMESTGVPGAIHVSEDTYGMLRNEPGWQPTGGIEVKGKGLMRTHLWTPPLISGAPAAAASDPPEPLMAHGSVSPHGPVLMTCGSSAPATAASAGFLRSGAGAAAAAGALRSAAGAATAVPLLAGLSSQGTGQGAGTADRKAAAVTAPPAIPDPQLLLDQMEALMRSIADVPAASAPARASGGALRAEIAAAAATAAPAPAPAGEAQPHFDLSGGGSAAAAAVAAVATLDTPSLMAGAVAAGRVGNSSDAAAVVSLDFAPPSEATSTTAAALPSHGSSSGAFFLAAGGGGGTVGGGGLLSSAAGGGGISAGGGTGAGAVASNGGGSSSEHLLHTFANMMIDSQRLLADRAGAAAAPSAPISSGGTGTGSGLGGLGLGLGGGSGSVIAECRASLANWYRQQSGS